MMFGKEKPRKKGYDQAALKKGRSTFASSAIDQRGNMPSGASVGGSKTTPALNLQPASKKQIKTSRTLNKGVGAQASKQARASQRRARY